MQYPGDLGIYCNVIRNKVSNFGVSPWENIFRWLISFFCASIAKDIFAKKQKPKTKRHFAFSTPVFYDDSLFDIPYM